MEPCFEASRKIFSTSGQIRWVQAQPRVLEHPVLQGDGPGDAVGCYVYGSVLRDQGMYRMWYQACPEIRDNVLVGYAESDDGLNWRRPVLNQVEVAGSRANNICDLPLHSPSVFIDPQAPASHRYRATGCRNIIQADGTRGAKGYCTYHSSDGLHWITDGPHPTWYGSDVITSIYHPGRGCGLAAMKYMATVNGSPRRAVMTAELRQGQWQPEPNVALVPDGFDDVAATARGYVGGDYYGMGMMPVGSQGTVGFIWQFRHLLPRKGVTPAIFGDMDVTLAYQQAGGDAWVHAPARREFIARRDLPAGYAGVVTASNVIEHGDECRLYLGLVRFSHGWTLDLDWQIDTTRRAQAEAEGFASIGLAMWTRDRLFGFSADPAGYVEIDLGILHKPVELHLNAQCHPRGWIKVDAYHYGKPFHQPISSLPFDQAIAVTGDVARAPARWQAGTTIRPEKPLPVVARIHMDRATLWGWEVVERE